MGLFPFIRFQGRAALIGGLMIVLGCLAGPLAQAQDLARVRRVIDTLASPTLFGRGYTQGGDQKAAAYLSAQFKSLGLSAWGGSHQQPFSLDVNTFPNRVSLALDEQILRPGDDFIVNAVSAKGKGSGTLYVLDTLIFQDKVDEQVTAARQQFLAQPLKGKIAVFRGTDYYKLIEMPVDFLRKLSEAKAFVSLEDKLTMTISSQQSSRPWFQVLKDKFPARAKKAKFRLDAQLVQGYQSQNVVGYWPGTQRPEEFIVFTAHYDHLGGLGKTAYFPGANDNASGISLLLELAAHYQKNPPPVSVAFIAFGGEEAGLVGSRYYVEHPLFPLRQIRFLLNLDLTGTGDEGIGVVNATIHEKEYAVFRQISTDNQYFTRIIRRGAAANSDHYFFGQAGVKAFFVYTLGGIKAYHDVNDRADRLPLTKYSELFGLMRDFADQMMKK
jgi:aminopeptidase YwaD